MRPLCLQGSRLLVVTLGRVEARMPEHSRGGADVERFFDGQRGGSDVPGKVRDDGLTGILGCRLSMLVAD